MIHCRLEKSSGLLVALESRGHASIDTKEARVSISCSVVSALIRSMGMLLEKRSDILAKVECFQPGAVSIRIVRVDEGAKDWLRGITDMLSQGLEDLERDFPDQLEFKEG